ANRVWKKEIIRNTFETNDVDRILQIPFARDEHADMVIWCGEPSGMFSTDCFEWLTWVFGSCMKSQWRLFGCSLWSIWLDKNRNLHEGKTHSKIRVANFTKNYIHELGCFKSASGIVVPNAKREVLVSKSSLHTVVGTTFDVKALACFKAMLTGIELGLTRDLNCGRGRVAFVTVADITDAIAVTAGIAVVNFF
ncbi:hypothetical protein Gohar_014072, partial [Gossypium harknessii]|nr:hypothetical protein [Gossypium harknessii]